MRFSLEVLVAIIVVHVSAVTAVPTELLKPLVANPHAINVVPDSYIVVYKNGVNASAVAAHMVAVRSMLRKRSVPDLGGVRAVYDITTFKGYNIYADSTVLQQIAASPVVAFIELDTMVSASNTITETSAPWGLGRLSHRVPGSTNYIYDVSSGEGTRVYVIDTGILLTHQQFGGRAVWGQNFVPGAPNTDDNGHGTHCSGIIGGVTFGVDRNVILVAVKVLSAAGTGPNSALLSGITWAVQNATFDGINKAVLSLSLGGAFSNATNFAVTAAWNAGLTTVVAAGNDGVDASNSSPASAAAVITVGATAIDDSKPSFSNFGPFVDLFAPGVNIVSAFIGSNTANATLSGTSMAAPHVAGLCAYFMALEGLSTPTTIINRLKFLATTGKITSPGLLSPNLLIYNGEA